MYKRKHPDTKWREIALSLPASVRAVCSSAQETVLSLEELSLVQSLICC